MSYAHEVERSQEEPSSDSPALDDVEVVRRLFAEFSDRMDGLRLGYHPSPRAVSPEEREVNAALDSLVERLKRAEALLAEVRTESRVFKQSAVEHLTARAELETALREIAATRPIALGGTGDGTGSRFVFEYNAVDGFAPHQIAEAALNPQPETEKEVRP